MDADFFSEKPVEVAEKLLGCQLVRIDGNKILKGRVVETEAYLGVEDPGSFASGGKTDRNSLMFDTYGKFFIYLSYGVHHMLNITAGRDKVGSVLIRAVEPLEGIEYMKVNRNNESVVELSNGPGKLTQAFGIDKNYNGKSAIGGTLKIEEDDHEEPVEKSRRIGISRGKEPELRFYLRGNRFVS